MSKSNAWENAYLLLLLNNVNAANIGDATGLRGSTAPGSLYLSLHTTDPGEAGDQTTNEVAYTNYARVAVSRNGAADITVTGNSAALNAVQSFPQGGAGASPTATFFGIGTSPTGAGMLCYSGPLTPNVLCGEGIVPQIGDDAGLITEE